MEAAAIEPSKTLAIPKSPIFTKCCEGVELWGWGWVGGWGCVGSGGIAWSEVGRAELRCCNESCGASVEADFRDEDILSL